MQAKTQKALELSLEYQQQYDVEIQAYIQDYNQSHPELRIRRNGGYFRSIRVWSEAFEAYLEICIQVMRVRLCGTNTSWVLQSALLSPRRHYLESFIVQMVTIKTLPDNLPWNAEN